MRWKWQSLPSLFLSLLLMVVTTVLLSCDRVESSDLATIAPKTSLITQGKLSELSPPAVIQSLNKVLEQYQPQVAILSPKPDETLSSTTVNVELQVQNYPTFQDPDFKLGPHLNLILDNNPYVEIYDPSKPYTLNDLTPGTHTLRVFASRPWDESFKNEGAYAQTTFNVLTPTGDNTPDPNQPLLTYNYPKGEFGAEPILIDYYLTNAPLHLVAQADSEDDIDDWRIRVTVNGESFVVDSWQPIYLKGFQEGENWIQLEFLDENGDRVDNAFNNTVRVINYHAKGQDTLSKITRGELTLEEVRSIVDRTYTPSIPSVKSESQPENPPEPSTTESKPVIGTQNALEPSSKSSKSETEPEFSLEPLVEKTKTEIQPVITPENPTTPWEPEINSEIAPETSFSEETSTSAIPLQPTRIPKTSRESIKIDAEPENISPESPTEVFENKPVSRLPQINPTVLEREETSSIVNSVSQPVIERESPLTVSPSPSANQEVKQTVFSEPEVINSPFEEFFE